MDRDPLNECDGRDETNDQDDLSAERERIPRPSSASASTQRTVNNISQM